MKKMTLFLLFIASYALEAMQTNEVIPIETYSADELKHLLVQGIIQPYRDIKSGELSSYSDSTVLHTAATQLDVEKVNAILPWYPILPFGIYAIFEKKLVTKTTENGQEILEKIGQIQPLLAKRECTAEKIILTVNACIEHQKTSLLFDILKTTIKDYPNSALGVLHAVAAKSYKLRYCSDQANTLIDIIKKQQGFNLQEKRDLIDCIKKFNI